MIKDNPMLAAIVERYENLASGRGTPITFDEILFMDFYAAGLNGTSFLEVVMETDIDLADMTDKEYLAVILGGFLGHDNNLYKIKTSIDTH